MRQPFIFALGFAMAASPALAQQTRGESTTGQTPAAAPTPQPTGKSRLEAGAEWLETMFGSGRAKNGFYAELDGLPPGSGISLGPGYRHQPLDGRAVIDASEAVSWSRGTLGQAMFALPRLAGNRISVGAQVRRQDFTRVSFFGIGPTSLEAEATDYRLRNTDYLAFAAVKPRGWLTLASRLGYSEATTIDRPRSAAHPASEDLFTDATAPGLAERPAFLHSDVYVDVDTRNHPSHPTSGGDYRITLSTFSDRDFAQYSFRRIEGEASRFIPILHENWVIALRARLAGTDTTDGNVVPFYLLPTLGGSTSLRGYDDYRFRDRNLLLLNAEYRWRVFGALDGALFYDAGNVAPRFRELDLTDLKNSYGIGFRFHSDDRTVFRLDVGHSVEGTRLSLSITEALRPGHGSIFIPYVP